jgi:NADH-quinone oxidoreductase subunit M
MGLVMMGFATLNRQGLLGAGVQMFSHGIMTALFFAVVGMVYDQAHTREIPKLGGFARLMPFAGVAFIVGGLVSMGMPGFSGFIAEFPIFMGLWNYENPLILYEPLIAIVAVISIVVTAAYILRVVGRVFYGQMPDEFVGHITDVSALDKVALVVLCVILIGVGVYPAVMTPLVESGVENVLRLLGGA